MASYRMTKVQDNGCTFYAILNEDSNQYFAGYNFMGGADWENKLDDAYWMGDDEAYQIMSDLKDADAPAVPEEPKMKLTKAQIKHLNALAEANWERAQGTLDGMNEILGTKYGWLAGRVVWFENPDCINPWAACHDAYAWAEH